MEKEKQALKDALRDTIHTRLEDLTSSEIKAKSRRIAKTLETTLFWREAEVVLCFFSMGKEVDTEPIFSMGLADGKDMAVPRLRKEKMDFHLIEETDGPWEIHPYGMREPHHALPIIHPRACPDRRVLIITPGLAFDRHANRLGRGGGYYDRYLNMECENVTTVGISFSIQIVPSIPMHDHDCPLDAVVTEDEVIYGERTISRKSNTKEQVNQE